jgi:predicted nicotinamide N-methyase
MDNTQVSYKKKELFALREHMGSSPFWWEFCLFGLFVGANYLMPNDASIFGQSILHCPFGSL